MLIAVEISLALWGIIVCAAMEAVQFFYFDAIVSKSSSGLDSGPTYGERPTCGGDASHGQSCDRPQLPDPPRAVAAKVVEDLNINSGCSIRVLAWQAGPPLLLAPPCADAKAPHTVYAAASRPTSRSRLSAPVIDLGCCSRQVSR